MEVQDFTKSIPPKDPDTDFPTLPTVEFTEDNWNTVYRGYCVEKSIYSYLVHSSEYGRFWIPKANVRLAKPKTNNHEPNQNKPLRTTRSAGTYCAS